MTNTVPVELHVANMYQSNYMWTNTAPVKLHVTCAIPVQMWVLYKSELILISAVVNQSYTTIHLWMSLTLSVQQYEIIETCGESNLCLQRALLTEI